MVQIKSPSDHAVSLLLAMQWLPIAPRKKARKERMHKKALIRLLAKTLSSASPHSPFALKNVDLYFSTHFMQFHTLDLCSSCSLSVLSPPGITSCLFRPSLDITSLEAFPVLPSLQPGLSSFIVLISVYQFATAAITKNHRLHGLNNRIFSLTILEAISPRSSHWQSWFLLKSIYRWPSSPVSSHDCSSVCDCVLIFSSYEDTCHVGLRLTLVSSF